MHTNTLPLAFSDILDADIRATLNSYQYLKRLLSERLDKQAPTMVCFSFWNPSICISFSL